MKPTKLNGIGVMSGTSLDGIDLAWCIFQEHDNQWDYNVLRTTTIPYTNEFKQKLACATEMSAYDYARLNVEWSELAANHIINWIGTQQQPDFIASHGHTVFHQPHLSLTTQIGSGAVLACRTGITTVCDFRTNDVALGGQGAPLVPIGDELLFGTYDACLNLGGFSNISFKETDHRSAFDISPCNMALNFWAEKMGMAYDKDGLTARKGKRIPALLEALNKLPFYTQKAPKSLGKEWFDTQILPIFTQWSKQCDIADALHTVTEHIAVQIGRNIPPKAQQILVTGGGALNTYLIEQIQQHCRAKIVLPDRQTIEFKEAIIFAFLGMLRLLKRENCLKSVTGARKNCCGGAVYIG